MCGLGRCSVAFAPPPTLPVKRVRPLLRGRSSRPNPLAPKPTPTPSKAKQLALLDALASRPRQGPIVLDGHGASSTTCGTSGDRTPSSGTDGTETIDSCSRQASALSPRDHFGKITLISRSGPGR